MAAAFTAKALGSATPCNSKAAPSRSWFLLPFKKNGVVVPRTYTYGWWVNDLVVPCAFGVSCSARVQAGATTRLMRGEEFRALIRAALKTW